MIIRKKNKPLFALIAFTGMNILTGISISSAVTTQTLNGNIAITECSGLVCLDIEVPQSIPANTNFLDPNGGKIPILFNYNLDQKIIISDSRSSGGFNVDLNITDLTNSADASQTINKTNIGVLSFNNNPDESVSLDNSGDESEVISNIDPDLFDSDEENLTYTRLKEEATTFPDEYYRYFPTDEGIRIITAPENPTGWHNNFSMGLAFIVKTPQNPAENLRTGTYQTLATFTLTQ